MAHLLWLGALPTRTELAETRQKISANRLLRVNYTGALPSLPYTPIEQRQYLDAEDLGLRISDCGLREQKP